MMRTCFQFAVCFTLIFPTTAVAAQRYDYCQMLDGRLLLFIIDRTDLYDEIDKEIVASAADKILNELNPGDRLVIHTITDDFATSQKLFDQCVPGCPEEGLIDRLLGTCREAIVRRDSLTFREDYARVLLSVVQNSEEHSGSSIIQTVSALTRQYENAHPEILFIFSDLVENSKLGNFLKMGKTQMDQAQASLGKLGAMAQLAGAKVVDFGFGRTQGTNRKGLTPEINARLEEFWRAYFQNAGATTVTIAQRYE